MNKTHYLQLDLFTVAISLKGADKLGDCTCTVEAFTTDFPRPEGVTDSLVARAVDGWFTDALPEVFVERLDPKGSPRFEPRSVMRIKGGVTAGVFCHVGQGCWQEAITHDCESLPAQSGGDDANAAARAN